MNCQCMSSANNYVNQIMITCYVMEFIYKEQFYQINTLKKTKLVIPCIVDSIQKFLGDSPILTYMYNSNKNLATMCCV